MVAVKIAVFRDLSPVFHLVVKYLKEMEPVEFLSWGIMGTWKHSILC